MLVYFSHHGSLPSDQTLPYLSVLIPPTLRSPSEDGREIIFLTKKKSLVIPLPLTAKLRGSGLLQMVESFSVLVWVDVSRGGELIWHSLTTLWDQRKTPIVRFQGTITGTG